MKRNAVRRSLAWLLVLVMALSAVPFGVFAESAEQVSNASSEEAPGGAVSPVEPQQEEPKQEEPKQEEPKQEEPKQEEPKVQDIQDEDTQVEAAQKCLCEDTAKCTEDSVNEKCPVCSEKDADLEKVCKGKTQEQLNAEAEAKKAEEEATKKAAEEAAQKASEEAVKNVQALIDALPEAETITEKNRDAVAAKLDAIDDAKLKLTDEQQEKLNFTKYSKAVSALTALDGTPGAENPSIADSWPTKAELMAELKIKGVNVDSDSYGSWQETYSGSGIFTKTISMKDDSNSGFYFYSDNSDNVTWGWGEGNTLKPNDTGSCFTPNVFKICTVNYAEYKILIVLDTNGYNEIDGTGMKLYPTPFTITFNYMGGSETQTTMGTMPSGYLSSLPSAEKPGYTFGGWYRNEECTGNEVIADTEDALFTADATLYAKWTPITYSVTFKDNGEELKTGVCVTYGTAIGESDIPKVERTGYRLVGWSKTENGAVEADLSTLTGENGATVALYAVWESACKTGQGSVVTPVDNETFLDKILNSKTDTLTITGSSVNDVSELFQKLGLDANTSFRAVDVILFRNGTDQLTELPYTLCFTFDVTGLNPNFIQVQRNHNGWAPMLRLAAKPTDGKTEGFYLKGNTLYIYSKLFSTFAAYSAPYTVTFDSNGGSKTPAKQTTDADGKLTSLPDAGTKEGNNFAYWYQKDAAGNETEVKANDTIFTADTTVYAKWKAWSYTVTFDGNGGKVKNSTKTSQDVSATYGTEVIPPDFVKDYYTVTAWARDADGTDKVSSPIKDLATKDGDQITLYAVWEYVPRTVTFDADGGKITENKTDVGTVDRKTQEEPINTLKASDIPVPNSREGWYFGGWYTQKDGKGDLVKAGSTEFKNETTVVYAYWIKFEPVTVTLKCQRGNMTINGKTVTTTTMETKWPGVIDGTLPTAARSGYKFQGWYTAAGVKVDEDTVFLRDTTIYARFTSAVSRTGNPKTGDRAMLGAAVAVLVVAAVGLGAAVVINKKKK